MSDDSFTARKSEPPSSAINASPTQPRWPSQSNAARWCCAAASVPPISVEPPPGSRGRSRSSRPASMVTGACARVVQLRSFPAGPAAFAGAGAPRYEQRGKITRRPPATASNSPGSETTSAESAVSVIPQQMLGTHRGSMLRLTGLEPIIRAPVVRRRSDLLEADSSDTTQPTPFAWRS